jgi:hypothetical protein
MKTTTTKIRIDQIMNHQYQPPFFVVTKKNDDEADACLVNNESSSPSSSLSSSQLSLAVAVVANNNNSSSIVNDIRKTRSSSVLRLLDDAIDEIPYHEKTGYLEAVRQCPLVIQDESDPLIFMRFEQYNIWAAARRLVKYWEWRVVLFGEEYAYTPILNLKLQHQLGNTDFLRILQDGSMAILPGTDIHGNSLVLVDKSRFHLPFEELDPIRLLRLVFYTWTLLTRQMYHHHHPTTAVMMSGTGSHRQDNYNDNDNGGGFGGDTARVVVGKERQGVVALSVDYELPTTTSHFAEAGKNLQSIFTDAFPIEVPIMHLLFFPTKTGLSTLVGVVIPVVLSIVSQVYSFLANIIPHVCIDKNDIRNHLEQYGIKDTSALPEVLEGTWSFNDFDSWFHEQLNGESCSQDIVMQKEDIRQQQQQQQTFQPQESVLLQQQQQHSIGSARFEGGSIAHDISQGQVDFISRDAPPLHILGDLDTGSKYIIIKNG